MLIFNVGAPGGPCVVGLDKATGREAWRAGKEWGPTYASPVPAVVYEKRRVFVFAGGESNPPTGGPLLRRFVLALPIKSRILEYFSLIRKGEAMKEERPQQRLKGPADYRGASRTCAL